MSRLRGGRPRRNQAADRAAARITAHSQTTLLQGSVFTLFPKLPIEVRLKIWKDAAPASEFIRVKVDEKRDKDRKPKQDLSDTTFSFAISSSGDRSQRWIRDLLEVSVSAVNKEARLAYLEKPTIALPTTDGGLIRYNINTMTFIANPNVLISAFPTVYRAKRRKQLPTLPSYFDNVKHLGIETISAMSHQVLDTQSGEEFLEKSWRLVPKDCINVPELRESVDHLEPGMQEVGSIRYAQVPEVIKGNRAYVGKTRKFGEGEAS